MPIAIAIAKTDNAKRWLLIARRIDGDEHVTVRCDGHVPRRRGVAILDEISDDERTESGRQGDPGIIRITANLAQMSWLFGFASITARSRHSPSRRRWSFRAGAEQNEECGGEVDDVPM